MRHTISVLVENEFGVLSRVSGLFSGRGFNIESLSVAPTLDPSISRMTIVTSGDDRILEQINKQLNKLISTIKVVDFTGEDFVERDSVAGMLPSGGHEWEMGPMGTLVSANITSDPETGIGDILQSAFFSPKEPTLVLARLARGPRGGGAMAVQDRPQHALVGDVLLDQLGPALHSGRAIFVYGHPGTGKTYICRRLSVLLTGAVLVPHAIAVSETVVQVFDAATLPGSGGQP